MIAINSIRVPFHIYSSYTIHHAYIYENYIVWHLSVLHNFTPQIGIRLHLLSYYTNSPINTQLPYIVYLLDALCRAIDFS